MALTDNLISYYDCEEASGNLIDIHGANDLTDTNTVGTAAGKVGNARDFEKDNSEYFLHTDNTDLSTGDIDWTFACWVNAETLLSFPVIANKGWSGSAGAREWVLYFNDSPNRFEFIVENSSSGTTTVNANNLGAPSTATWYHIVIWHDASANQIGIAVNAGTADTAAHTTGVRDSAGDFRIGASPSQSLYWDGLIDEAGFWKRVLTSQERTDLYNGGAGLAYADFGGGAATFVPYPRPRGLVAGMSTMSGGF